MRAFLATFLIFCQFLNAKSQEKWSCRNEKPILYYVENQNQIIAYNVSTGRSRMLNRKMDGVGKIVDLMGHFIDNETALFTVVDDDNPHRNDIKFCCNPNAILVHAQPDTEYRNLILDDKRGRFLWIAETSSEGKVMVSGTDGKNIRDVYTAEKIYSIGYDVEKQQVYVATEDNIKLVNVKSKQQNVVIQAKASQVFYYNCSFYFKDRKTGAISMYTSDRRTKQLVRKTDPELPFTVSYEKEYFEFSDICQTITCAKYCVYGESENGKIPRCIDPEDLIDLDNSDCSTFSWLTILFFIIALVFFILLVLELTSSVISNCCNRVKQINNPDQTTVQE
ncbi:hypothetical protein M3Y97_00923100 [Aphelenchoides bicaudatus]|nr:hypothetical protein M3Y97_00923100 [Aphelenchoides bicaudatus]